MTKFVLHNRHIIIIAQFGSITLQHVFHKCIAELSGFSPQFVRVSKVHLELLNPGTMLISTSPERTAHGLEERRGGDKGCLGSIFIHGDLHEQRTTYHSVMRWRRQSRTPEPLPDGVDGAPPPEMERAQVSARLEYALPYTCWDLLEKTVESEGVDLVEGKRVHRGRDVRLEVRAPGRLVAVDMDAHEQLRTQQ